MNKAAFSPRSIVMVLAVATGLFALSIILSSITPDDVTGFEKYKAHSYSTSLIGHAGFYETMRLMGRPVKRGLDDSLEMAGSAGTVLVIEPHLNVFEEDYGTDLLDAPRLLIVLPKWLGLPSSRDRGWVQATSPLPLSLVQEVLDVVAEEATVARRPWPTEWLDNDFGLPFGNGDVQLIKSSSMKPLIGTSEGMLLGDMSVDDRRIWVLADPDILSNQGLGKGNNAALIVSIIDELRLWDNTDANAPIVFDEVVHGIKLQDRSFWNMLFRFPYVLVTILAAVSALLMVLAGAGRFGAPLMPKPELDFGKANLIANSVRLLDFAGHHGEILKNYIWMIIRMTARDLHAPKGQGDQAVLDWLDRLGRTRGVSRPCSEIVRSINLDVKNQKNAEHLYLCARDIHYWKGEILNGSKSPRSHS